MKAKNLFFLVSIILMSIFFGACGGGGGSDSPDADNQSSGDQLQDGSSESGSNVSSCESYSESIGEVINVSTVSELESAVGRINNEDGPFTILIADGTYNLNNGFWITGSDFIIRSQSGNRDAVVLNGKGMSGGVSHIFWILGENTTIADISFGNVANHAIQIMGESARSADDITVYNVRIFDTGEQMIKGSSDGIDGAADGIVECSLLEYTNSFGPQWYIGGIDIHRGSNWIVRNNTFKNIRSPEAGSGPSEHAVHFWNNSENITVESNTIINCDRGIGLGLGDSSVHGGVIRNNMIYNNGQGLNDDVGIGLESADNILVYNNTIFFDSDYPNAIEYRFEATTGTEIYGNLSNRAISQRNNGQATLQNNITTASADWFINAPNGDLHLADAISSVVDQGLFIDGLDVDIDGDSRNLGTAPDIGADEFNSDASSSEEQSDGEEPGGETVDDEQVDDEALEEQPIENPSDLALLDISDVTYQGGFRLSSSRYGPTEYSNLNYSPGPIVYNPENHSLFVLVMTMSKELPNLRYLKSQIVETLQILLWEKLYFKTSIKFMVQIGLILVLIIILGLQGYLL